MSRLIKRYGNRKMYDPQTSRYVTLDGIAELVRAGEDLRIIDNDNGEDLTALTFAQIIFEEEKRKSGLLGLPVLRSIIQRGGATLQEILSSVDRGREALGNVRDLAEKSVRQLVHSEPRLPAAGRDKRRLLDEILELPQKQIEQLQQRIDSQVRASLERVAAHPAFQTELRRIEESIKNLERQLSRLHRREISPQRSARNRAAKKGTGR